MSSSLELSTDSFTISDASSPQRPSLNTARSQLEKIGPGRQFFKWTADSHKDFITWWSTTEWYLNNEEKGRYSAVINWNSTTRTSDCWQHFYQAANSQTGYPCIICQHCSASIEHPKTKNTGTKALRNHIGSAKCRKSSFTSSGSYKQTQLFQTAVAQV